MYGTEWTLFPQRTIHHVWGMERTGCAYQTGTATVTKQRLLRNSDCQRRREVCERRQGGTDSVTDYSTRRFSMDSSSLQFPAPVNWNQNELLNAQKRENVFRMFSLANQLCKKVKQHNLQLDCTGQNNKIYEQYSL